MRHVLHASWLCLALAGCAEMQISREGFVATWYLSRNCDRIEYAEQRACDIDMESKACLEARALTQACTRGGEPKLYVGLLNRSTEMAAIERLTLNGISYSLHGEKKDAALQLDPGRILFVEIDELESVATFPQDGTSAQGHYWQCHLPVVAALVLKNGKTAAVETVSTVPSALTKGWRTGCVFPPIP